MASHRRVGTFFLYKTLRANWKRRQQIQNIVTLLLMEQQKLLIVLALMSLILCSSTTAATRIPRIRSCRRKLRKRDWWESVCKTYSEKRFRKTFRISRTTFNHILNKIRADIQHGQGPGRLIEPISPECRLGITLYRLARGDYYYTIS